MAIKNELYVHDSYIMRMKVHDLKDRQKKTEPSLYQTIIAARARPHAMTKREGLLAMGHEEDSWELAAEAIDTPAESVTEALEVAVAEATEVDV